MTYDEAFLDYSLGENGEVVAEAVDPKDIDQFILDHNLPYGAKSMIRTPSDKIGPGSKTVIIYYRPKKPEMKMRTIILGYSSRFTYAGLRNYVQQYGFDIYDEFLDNPTNVTKTVNAYFLLKLPDPKRPQKTLILSDIHSKLVEKAADHGYEALKWASYSIALKKKPRIPILRTFFVVCRDAPVKLNKKYVEAFLQDVRASCEAETIKMAILICSQQPDSELRAYFESFPEYQGKGKFKFVVVSSEEEISSLEFL
jgi:hypothetical protein